MYQLDFDIQSDENVPEVDPEDVLLIPVLLEDRLQALQGNQQQPSISYFFVLM